MFGNRKWPAAAVAAGLVALAALIGCGEKKSVASKSAAAFQEAQKKGETFGGEGHAHGNDHGHGAAPSGGEPAETTGEEHHAGHGAAGGRSPVDHSAMGHGAGAHAGHAPQQSGSTRPEATGAGHQGHQAGGHAAVGHGGSASTGKPAATSGHAGHGAPSPQPSAGHSGHSPSGSGTPSTPVAPVAELPTQPASILRPDTLDAPAATSVVDAQRSVEMNQAMSGGHGGHGTSTYRHVDAGRGPGAHEGSEPQTPGAGPQHHDHGAATGQSAAVYVCPMHPEVTSNAPGTCPKCGMALVERREE